MRHDRRITRRRVLKGSAAAAGALLARRAAAFHADPPWAGAAVIDCHAHFHHPARPDYRERDRLLIEAADKLGIDLLCCSTLTPQRPATVEGFREANRSLVEAIGRFPGRVLGYCYVNPGHTREALDEIRRYVEDHGFIGVKRYTITTWPTPARTNWFRPPPSAA